MHYTSTSNKPLTIDEIGRYAPSALATTKHDSRSNRYTYIPTMTVVENLMKNGFQVFKATQSLARLEDKRNFTKHMLRMRHESVILPLQPGTHNRVSVTFPEIVLVNSHDGSSAYDLMLGMFELLCTNSLVVSHETVASFKVRHSGNIADKVVEGAFTILENAKQVMGVVEPWKQLQLTSGEQQIFAEAAHQVRFGNSEGETDTVIQPAQLLTARRYQDNKPDLWSTFNRVQENVIRGGLQGRTADQFDANGDFVRRGRRVSTREVKGIDQDVKLNRALWTLAEKMAELKQAA